MATKLTFLHLSDIHFTKRSGTKWDLDQDLRNQIELDVESSGRRLGIACQGIIVSGDIAFSGHPDEYSTAKSWLDKLCRQLGCAEENVWTIPGNHDVDRNAINRSLIIRNLHRTLRPADPAHVDRELTALLYDSEANEAIHRPFAAYNQFASAYGCRVGADNLYWEDSLPLNDGSMLRLRGINSALISNAMDDDGKNRMIVGSQQSRPPEEKGGVYMLICHHPVDWVWDRDSFQDDLKSRTKIALFGHKHTQRVERVNETLRIAAGAVHPDRSEGNWLPRYNFVSLHVLGTAEERRLRVDVISRIWNDERRRFRSDTDDDGNEAEEFELKLPVWLGPPACQMPTVDGTASSVAVPAPIQVVAEAGTGGTVMNPERRLTYRFFDLPFRKRMEIVTLLGLIENEDETVREEERYKRYFQRAKNRSLLHNLWNEVESRHLDGITSANPFGKA